MTTRSKIAILSLIIQTVIFGWMYRAISISTTGVFDFKQLLVEWAQFFLLLLLVSVVALIIVTILINIVSVIFTKKSIFHVSDERDFAIENKSVRNLSYVFSFGWFLSLALTVWIDPNLFFHTMAWSYMIASLAFYGSQIFFYERGY